MNSVLRENGKYNTIGSSVEYISHKGDDSRAANAARVYFGKDKLTSSFEHSVLSVKITCPLVIRSQIMRQRTFSYSEVSRRYTNDNIEFFDIQSLKSQANENLHCSTEGDIGNLEITEHLVKQAYTHALRTYELLLSAGLSREKARFILPQGVMTSFWMTGNLLNWFRFLSLRLDDHAQEECREVAQEILEVLKKHFPHTVKVFQENKSI